MKTVANDHTYNNIIIKYLNIKLDNNMNLKRIQGTHFIALITFQIIFLTLIYISYCYYYYFFLNRYLQ